MKIKSKKSLIKALLFSSTVLSSFTIVSILSSCSDNDDNKVDNETNKVDIYLSSYDVGVLGLNKKSIITENDLEGYEVILKDAFKSNEIIEEIHFPASIRKIEESAFENCTNLKKITFSENSMLDEIKSSAFYNTGLISNYHEQFKLPNSITKIGRSAFSSPKIEIFNYPENVEVIYLDEVDAHYNVDNKTYVDLGIRLPKKLKKIADGKYRGGLNRGFKGFLDLDKNLDGYRFLPGTLEEIEGRFTWYGYYAEDPDTGEYIANSLPGRLYIPGSVKIMSDSALDRCPYQDIYLPPHLYNVKDTNNKNKRYGAPEEARIYEWDGKTYPTS